MKTLCILLGLLTSTAVFSQNEKKQLNTQNTADFLVDKKASPETLALFYNLKQTAQKGFAIGQQDAFNGFYSNKKGKSDIKKTTGTDPAVIGLDFSFITDNKNKGQSGNWHYEQEQKIISYTKKAYNKGMIISYCWHFREPYKGEEFYVDQMTEIQKNAVQSILPNGENHEYYKTKLDKIAATAKKLIGSDGKLIPVIFRPFHEFDGSWFWWGADFCSVQQYIELYQFTVKYLRDTKGVTNFLYAFSPDNRFSNTEEYLQRYPGDSYVDLLGMDNYGDFDNKGEQGIKMANEKLKILSDLAKQRNKIAAMTETGYQITGSKKPIEKFFSKNIYDSLTQNNLEISYVLFWGNSQNGYFVPPPNEPDTADFIEFTKKTKSVLLNKLPSMYKMPKK